MYLSKVSIRKIDTMILGCTHYPVIKQQIMGTLSKTINIIDSSTTNAEHIKKYLQKYNLIQTKKIKQNTIFYVTDDPLHFKKQANFFLSKPIKNIIKTDIK